MIVERAQLVCKVESVEGTAETLLAADAILAMNVSFKPTISMKTRENIASSISPFSQVPGARSAVMDFDVEYKGSGTAATPPAFGKLLKCCGFGETIAATVTYVPASTTISSMTLALYNDGMIYKMWGARGNVSLKLVKGDYGVLHFTFTGADFSIIDGAVLTAVTYESTKPQPFLGASSFTIDSYAALISSLDFNMNNTVMLRPDIVSTSGNKSAVITNRSPSLTLDPEGILVATYDFFGKWRSGSEGAIAACVVGASAGNILTLTAPKVQYTGGSLADRSGLRSFGITCQLNRNAGDDEISIVHS